MPWEGPQPCNAPEGGNRSPKLFSEKSPYRLIWDDVVKKYQMPDDSDSFTTVSQVYTNPFYYIGYGTSALVAFDLYVESLTDHDAAVTKYLKMSEVPPETVFRKMLEIAGINDVLDAKTVSGLCQKLDIALCE